MNRCLSLLQGTRLLAFVGQKLYILRRQQIIFRPEKTYLNCGVCVHSSEFSHSILLSLVTVENSKYLFSTLYSAASSWGAIDPGWMCLWLELEQWKSKQGVQGSREGCDSTFLGEENGILSGRDHHESESLRSDIEHRLVVGGDERNQLPYVTIITAFIDRTSRWSRHLFSGQAVRFMVAILVPVICFRTSLIGFKQLSQLCPCRT